MQIRRCARPTPSTMSGRESLRRRSARYASARARSHTFAAARVTVVTKLRLFNRITACHIDRRAGGYFE